MSEALTPEGYIVIVGRRLNSLNFSANVELLGLIMEVGNRRMSDIIGSKNLFCFEGFVGRVDIEDFIRARQYRLSRLIKLITGQDSEWSFISGIPKSDSNAWSQTQDLDIFR